MNFCTKKIAKLFYKANAKAVCKANIFLVKWYFLRTSFNLKNTVRILELLFLGNRPVVQLFLESRAVLHATGQNLFCSSI